MKIINVIKKTVAQNEVVVLDLCNNKQGDVVVGDIYIDLPTNNVVTISGSVDGETWHAIKAVDMCNLAKADAVTLAGYYMVPAAGLSKAKFVFGSAGDVVFKETF